MRVAKNDATMVYSKAGDATESVPGFFVGEITTMPGFHRLGYAVETCHTAMAKNLEKYSSGSRFKMAWS